MAAIFCCGFECGVLGATDVPADVHHFSAGGVGASITTTSPRTGLRCFNINATTNPAYAESKLPELVGGTLMIIRFYFNVSSNPTTDNTIGVINSASAGRAGICFKSSDSKYYLGAQLTGTYSFGTTGVTLGSGWHYAEVRINIAANPWVIHGYIDNTDLGSFSPARAADTVNSLIIGCLTSATMNISFDDILISTTTGDFPMGKGSVQQFIPTVDGTHNIAGANDFERTLTGTDILNATTDAYLLVDDETPETGTSGDFINMVAPPNATDYVECIFGPGTGISTPTTPPRAVEIITALRQFATGTGNMEVRINDNGTTDALYSATGVAGVTTVFRKRKFYATGPSGGAWVIGGGGNGDFTDLRVRFGSPAALDVNPDQYFHSIMVEAEFAEITQRIPRPTSIGHPFIF